MMRKSRHRQPVIFFPLRDGLIESVFKTNAGVISFSSGRQPMQFHQMKICNGSCRQSDRMQKLSAWHPLDRPVTPRPSGAGWDELYSIPWTIFSSCTDTTRRNADGVKGNQMLKSSFYPLVSVLAKKIRQNIRRDEQLFPISGDGDGGRPGVGRRRRV